MSAYQSYCKECKHHKVINPYKDEIDFNRSYGIETEKEIPVFVARKNSSAKEVKPTLKAHINIKPPKEKRAYQYASTEEERKIARTQSTKKQREEWKAAGLTSKGKPFKK